MSRLTRDGTAEPVSRDQTVRRKRGHGNVYFPCSADHEQDWQPHPDDPYSAIMYGHTYSKSVDQPGKVANPARGQLNRENIFLSAFASEYLVSRDVFGSPVPRQPAHLQTQGESGAYFRDSSRVPRRRPICDGHYYLEWLRPES